MIVVLGAGAGTGDQRTKSGGFRTAKLGGVDVAAGEDLADRPQRPVAGQFRTSTERIERAVAAVARDLGGCNVEEKLAATRFVGLPVDGVECGSGFDKPADQR